MTEKELNKFLLKTCRALTVAIRDVQQNEIHNFGVTQQSMMLDKLGEISELMEDHFRDEINKSVLDYMD